MGTGRWRFELVEDADNLPVPWRPPARMPYDELPLDPGSEGALALLAACDLLVRRGVGHESWSTSFRHNPIAFLLDALSDAVNLWAAGGELVYHNLAAERLQLGPPHEAPLEVLPVGEHSVERRCVRFTSGGAEYVLEVIHILPG